MRKTAWLIIAAMGLSACATLSPKYRLGAQAEMNKQWEEAIAYYEKASLENPKEPAYRVALVRAKISASLFHLEEARKLVALDKREEAKVEYAKAIFYNPRDPALVQEAKTATAEKPKEEQPKTEKIEFPIKLKAKEESLKLKFPVETSLKSIFLALGKAAGISIVFDENFRDIPFMTDLTDMTFEQAVRSLCLASRNFYRIVDERTVIIIPDNAMKRMQYDVNCIKTFYLSNILAQDMMAALSTMLRSTTKAPSIIFDKNLNSVTIRDTPQVVELAERLIKVWDKPKAEVVIDMEIMEVSRLKLRQLGISFDQNIIGAQYGTPTTTTDTTSTTTGWFNLKDIDFTKAENFSISLPVGYLQFLESDADTKIVAQPRLRGVSDEDMRHLVGQKVPIPRTTFQPFAAGGYAQQPITNFDFQDVGIEVKLKPTVHMERDVTLGLEIKVTSLGGKGYADIPIINTREIKNTMRLKDGETNLIAGLLRDEERRSFKGIPGLMSIPVIGRLFSAEDTTLEQTDVILTITPYIVRAIPVTAEDSKPLWVDVETPPSGQAGGGVSEDEVLGRVLDVRQAEQALRSLRPDESSLTQITLSPANIELPVGRDFAIAVNFRSDQEIGSLSLSISFNPQLVTLKDAIEGGLTRQMGEKIPFLKNIDSGAGVCTLGFSSPQIGRGLKGGGTLATLTFTPKGAGECPLTITSCIAASASGQAVSFRTQDARIVIR
jgi:general secretion pathway protein D